MKLLIIASFVVAVVETANGVRHLLENDSAGSIIWFVEGILFAGLGIVYNRQLKKKREQAGLK